MSEPEPHCVSAEVEARRDPLADGALVVREYVRWEDVHEEGKILHGPLAIRKKMSVCFVRLREKAEVPHLACRTCRRCAR